MEYQVDVSGYISDKQRYKKERDQKIAKEFAEIRAQLIEDGFPYGSWCRVYKDIARRYGISDWTVMRIIKNSREQ